MWAFFMAGLIFAGGFGVGWYCRGIPMDKTEMIYGTRAVMEAIKAGREIEKIYIQAGLTNDLIKELINTAKASDVPFSFHCK